MVMSYHVGTYTPSHVLKEDIMSFTKKQLVATDFGFHLRCECAVCGSEWVEACSNETRPSCCRTAKIREWDGTVSIVGFRRGHKSSRNGEGEEMVEIVYQDGLRYKVSYDYLLELMV